MNFDIMSLIIPELLVLVPVNWGIGLVVKSSKMNNKFIPVINAIISVSLATLYTFSNNTGSNIGMNIFSGFTQGLICWIIAWLTYEKYIKKLSSSNTDDTTADDEIDIFDIDEEAKG